MLGANQCWTIHFRAISGSSGWERMWLADQHIYVILCPWFLHVFAVSKWKWWVSLPTMFDDWICGLFLFHKNDGFSGCILLANMLDGLDGQRVMEYGSLPCVPKILSRLMVGIILYTHAQYLRDYHVYHLSLSSLEITMNQPLSGISHDFPLGFRHFSTLLMSFLGMQKRRCDPGASADPAQAPNSARAWWGWRFRGTNVGRS